MATTPIPRWDIPKLHRSENLSLFGAGREKRIYAVPPHTDVTPLTFDDVRGADEVFSTGNLDKILPATRIDGRDFQPGPIAKQARALYFQWAETQTQRRK